MKRTTLYTCLGVFLLGTSTLSYADNSVSNGMATAGQSVSNGMATAGQSVGHGMAVTGRVISDSTITTMIKSKYLADSTLKSFQIGVETTKGVVALTGQVGTKAQYKHAIRIAKNTSGVTSVDASSLKIVAPGTKTS